MVAMTMSKGLITYLGVKVSKLKVMCGLSLDSSAREERAIQNVTHDPIPASKFISTHKQRLKNGQLETEFKALSRNQEDHPSQAALRNVLLNNKQDVVPCDHSRVIVWDSLDMVGSDYYNASFIDGYNDPKEYIASQGPSSKTFAAFWHMVWQEGVACIVMATGLFENAVQQCDKYWVDHSQKHARYGSIHVWHEESTHLAQLNIRVFRIQKEGSCDSRMLTHFEMIGLHEECPNSGLLLDVRRRVQALSSQSQGPVLVHCRCGGGRSAVYLAVDYCLQKLQAEDRVDVYSAVLHLRRFRKNMVKTEQQYRQIYDAVGMYIQCGVTVYPRQQLPDVFRMYYARRGEAKSHRLEREFQSLQNVVPKLSIGDCASGHRVENRSKSRDIMMLPPECARPYLTTADCGDGGTDFINAAYIDGYHAENTYLVTQWPIKRTLGDIWRLLFDFKITSLVVMNEVVKFSRNYPRFWPKEINQVANYGPISVRYLSCNRRPDLVVRTFAVRKPKRHPHLIAQALVRISEDVMIMNNLVGCELRQDEIIIKMFQVVGGSSGHIHSSCRRKDIRKKSQQNRQHKVDLHSDDPRRGSYDIDEIPLGYNDDINEKKSSVVGVESRSLLAVMEHVEEWQKRCGSRHPVCVMSKDGCSRVGLYCTVSICSDQLKTEQEIDVFNAVRYARVNRPQLVPTMEEYRYIYRFMTEYILLSKTRPDIVITKPKPSIFTRPELEKSANTMAILANSLHGGVYIRNQPFHYPSVTGAPPSKEEKSLNSSIESQSQNGLPIPACGVYRNDNRYPDINSSGCVQNTPVPSLGLGKNKSPSNSHPGRVVLNGSLSPSAISQDGGGSVSTPSIDHHRCNSDTFFTPNTASPSISSQSENSTRFSLSSNQPLSAASLLTRANGHRQYCGDWGNQKPSNDKDKPENTKPPPNCINSSLNDIPVSSRASTSNSNHSARASIDKTPGTPMQIQSGPHPRLQKCFLSPGTYVNNNKKEAKKASSSSLCTNSSFQSCNSSLTEALSRSSYSPRTSSSASSSRSPEMDDSHYKSNTKSHQASNSDFSDTGVGISILYNNGFHPLSASDYGSNSSNRCTSFTSLSTELSGIHNPQHINHYTSASSTPRRSEAESTLIHASYASLEDSLGDSLEDHYSSLEWVDLNNVNTSKQGERNGQKESKSSGRKSDLRNMFWSKSKVIPWPSPLTLVKKVKGFKSNRGSKV